MSRFFVSPNTIKGKAITISGKEAHHVLDVMRLKVSDSVVAFDGTGKEYTGFIKDVFRNSLTIEVTQIRSPSLGGVYRITLIQAITKKDKMDYIVEKATELGVRQVCPVMAHRTIPVWDDEKRDMHRQRWRKIAKEAAKQCGRSDVPEISQILDFTEAIKNFSAYGVKLIAVLAKNTVPMKDVVAGNKSADAVIAIGPEGDFTALEAEKAELLGFRAVSLGPLVLKSDTAGLTGIAILNYELSS